MNTKSLTPKMKTAAKELLFQKVNCGYDRWNDAAGNSAGTGQLPDGVRMTDSPDFVAGKTFAEFGAEGHIVSPCFIGEQSGAVIRNYYGQPEKVVSLN